MTKVVVAKQKLLIILNLPKLPKFLVRRLQIQRSAKIPTMGCTWRTAHCRDFLLAAVDVCLITRNLLFTCHNSKNHRISMYHRITTDVGEVTDRLIHIVVDDTLNRLNTAAIHRHKSRDNSCRDT